MNNSYTILVFYLCFGLVMGDLESCSCSKLYLPVCGTDNKTYNNNCLFECFANSEEGRKLNLKISYNREC